MPELDLQDQIDGGIVRERDAIYGEKFLGRIRGRLND
jgi:hypothetical protein